MRGVEMPGIQSFLFLQAEDGIRDVAVTGVQTCALPIWTGCAANGVGEAPLFRGSAVATEGVMRDMEGIDGRYLVGCGEGPTVNGHHWGMGPRGGEIGRASCRERV